MNYEEIYNINVFEATIPGAEKYKWYYNSQSDRYAQVHKERVFDNFSSHFSYRKMKFKQVTSLEKVIWINTMLYNKKYIPFEAFNRVYLKSKSKFLWSRCGCELIETIVRGNLYRFVLHIDLVLEEQLLKQIELLEHSTPPKDSTETILEPVDDDINKTSRKITFGSVPVQTEPDKKETLKLQIYKKKKYEY